MNSSRTFLISGARGGIGNAICQQLLEQGHHIIALTRSHEQLFTESGRCTTVQIDLADTRHLPAQLHDLAKQHPNIDGLILCAGKGQFGGLEEFSYEQIQQLMDLNFLSQAWLTRAFLPTLKRKQQGDVIFIGSEAALTGSRKGSIYCASKFALRGFSQALRDECAKSGIRVTLINPGMVKTDFFDELSFKHGEDESNYILPDDVAEAVSMVINLRGNTVIDEINLSPRNHGMVFNSNKQM